MRFASWAQEQGLAPKAVDIPMLLDYFLYLKASGLALNSIRVHAVAFSAFHLPVEEHSIFTPPLTAQFWKSLVNKYLPIQPITPQWDLSLVLTSLMNTPFKPLAFCSLSLLSMKVAFLVTITAARRAGKLRAMIANLPLTVFHKDKVSLHLHPKFLPKVVSCFHLY